MGIYSYSRNSLAASKSLIDNGRKKRSEISSSISEPDPTGYISFMEKGCTSLSNIEEAVAPNGTPDEVQNTYGMSMPS